MGNNRIKKTWPTPKIYGVGHFTDFNLYKEALSIALNKGFINMDILSREIPQRIKGLIVVDSISKTSYQDLIKELLYYNFIQKPSRTNELSTDNYIISDKGQFYLNLCHEDKAKALDYLLREMQNTFITPGWFVNRLWELNPIGQGQLVIPLPIKEWHPKSCKWRDNVWTSELENICQLTGERIQKKIPGAFPFDIGEWCSLLKMEYLRLGNQHPKNNQSGIKEEDVHYSQRNRLSLAMKTVAVRKFFSRENPITKQLDFPNKRSDMTHRSFMVWCPRLENFNMIFYTDNNPEIPGRLLFPISTFKTSIQDSSKYIVKDFIRDTQGGTLYIHSPKWENIKDLFIETLIEVYQRYYDKQTIIYISLQDIRDEVCRLLRISPTAFEIFLQNTYELSIQRKINYSISLETDLRLDMKVQINRRGVFLNKMMYTLIAIKPL